MALTPLTAEERRGALAKAAQVRKVRAEAKAELKSGQLSLTGFFDRAEGDDDLARIKVSALIASLPGVGSVGAQKAMSELGIAESRRVRGLGPHQKAGLLTRFV